MTNAFSVVPVGLLLPSLALVGLALFRGGDSPPEPAEVAALEWDTLTHHRGQPRGPLGTGLVFNDVKQFGAVTLAAAPNQFVRSVDSGRTWLDVDGTGAFSLVRLRNDVLLAGRFGGRIARSADSGSTWKEQRTDGEGVVLTVVSRGDTVFATGFATILRSTDAGVSWRRSWTPRVVLADIAWQGNSLIGVGGAGLVLRSADAGETWTSTWLPTLATLNGVAFADERTVVIVGSDGAIQRSTDAGLSWSVVSSPTVAHLLSVAFVDPANGLAVGWWGEVIRTGDGGATWHRERSGTRLHYLQVTPLPPRQFLVSGAREVLMLASLGAGR